MSVMDKFILYGVVATFIAYPMLLLWAWVTTKAWRNEPAATKEIPSGEQAVRESRAA